MNGKELSEALSGALKKIDKAPILEGLKGFSFTTKKGEVRRYEKTPNGWLKTWSNQIEDNLLTVKLVYIMSKKDGSLKEEKEEASQK